jgi:hypothetical protein
VSVRLLAGVWRSALFVERSPGNLVSVSGRCCRTVANERVSGRKIASSCVRGALSVALRQPPSPSWMVLAPNRPPTSCPGL